MSFSVGLWSDGPNDSSVNFQSGGRITSNYTRTYLYKTDASSRPTDAAIVTDIGISPGSPHPDDANATCHKVEVGPGPEKTRQPHLAYLVKVEWSTLSPLPNTVSTDPTTMRTLWTLGATIQQRYVIRDRNGNMILNAAGQPFAGGVPVSVRLGKAVATKNRSASGYNKNTVMAYSGMLNSATYLGAAAGTLQVDIEAKEQYEGGFHYWAETYTFSYDPLGWQPKPLNAGLWQKKEAGSNTLRRILTGDLSEDVRLHKTGDPIQEPEPLLANGLIVPAGSSNRPSLCNFISVDYFATMDFATFSL